jgi:hypothetical protein
MASSLPDSMIVCLRLQNVVFADLSGIVTNQLSAAFTEDGFPSFLRIDFDTLSDIVSI